MTSTLPSWGEGLTEFSPPRRRQETFSFSKLYVGIDPGKQGFVAVIDSDKVVDSSPIPTVDRDYDIRGMTRLARGWKARRVARVVLEEQQPAYLSGAGDGKGANNMVRASFGTGRGYGMWEGILSAVGLPYITVRPSVWKKKMGIIVPKGVKGRRNRQKESKRLSVERCAEAFPGADLRRSTRGRVPCPDKAEAILLARYGVLYGG